MLLKFLDNLIYMLSNIRNNVLDKQLHKEDEFAWIDQAAIEYEKYSL